jgi:hypothetical protein
VLQHVADFGPTFLGRVHLQRACSATRLVEWRWAPPLSISEDLSGLGLGDAGACAVAEALARETSHNVVRLHVSNNAIGDRGAAALAGALAKSRAPVRRVYMEDNEVGLVGARAMMAAIASIGTLKEVDLCGNRLSSAVKKEVRYARKGKQMLLDWNLPSPTYMSDTQPQINARMRCILFDWLMDVFASSFHTPMSDSSFSPPELFQTFSIVDRYLSRRAVARERFQLVGAAGAFVSARHCEVGADSEPEALQSVRRLVRVSDNAFTDEDLLRTAGDIRDVLENELDQPTVYTLLLRYLVRTGWQMRGLLLSEYLLHLAALSYPVLFYRPQVVVAAVVALTHSTLGEISGAVAGWQQRLLRYAKVTREEVAPCLQAVALLHASARQGSPALKGDGKILSAFRKFSRQDMQEVAKLELAHPASALLPQSSGGALTPERAQLYASESSDSEIDADIDG